MAGEKAREELGAGRGSAVEDGAHDELAARGRRRGKATGAGGTSTLHTVAERRPTVL